MQSRQAEPEKSLDRRQLLAAMRAFRRGEFAVRLPDELDGVDGQICEAFNDMVQFGDALRAEIVDLRQSAGREGRTHKRLPKANVRGAWTDYVNGVNELLDDMTSHTAELARVAGAVGKGDLTQVIDLDGKDIPLRGDFLRHARATRVTSPVICWLSETTSLNSVASSTSASVPSSGILTEKSPRRSLRRAEISSRLLRENSIAGV